MLKNLQGIKVYLGSKSPRRKELLGELIPKFEVLNIDVEEVYDAGLSPIQIAEYLSELKAKEGQKHILKKDLLITSDTIVVHKQVILGKPVSEVEAINMLQTLSGDTHQVISAVTICHKHVISTFHEITEVTFKPLSLEEIHYYVSQFKPMDKAGAYGIQEWIGKIGVTSIKGSYYNVMGLPVQRLYEQLKTVSK
ncbi:MAG: septum formation protein Maf [Flavobacteriales bacterium]|nr:septum formation protein Maf [Flavobacteriales bacterium]